jgi:hypothetical protein
MSKNKKFTPRRDIPPEAVDIIRIQSWAKVTISFFKLLAALGIGYCIYLSVDSLAGKITLANFILEVFGNVTINKWLAYAIGSGGLGYGYIERKLRQKNIKRMTQRITDLESIINRKRKSSELTKTGNSPK